MRPELWHISCFRGSSSSSSRVAAAAAMGSSNAVASLAGVGQSHDGCAAPYVVLPASWCVAPAGAEQHFIKYVLAFFAGSDGIVLENLAVRFMQGEARAQGPGGADMGT